MTFTAFGEAAPPGPEPKTNDPGTPHPGQSQVFTKAQPQRTPSFGKVPKNSVFRRMSALARFRQSPAYRKLRDKIGHQDTDGQKPMMQSDTFTPANLKERAEAMIEFVQTGGRVENLFRLANGHRMIVESMDDFADSVIALLIDAGFDDNLVEVEVEDGSVMVYLDEHARAKHKDVRNLLAEIANVELVAQPDDNPELGTYIYRVAPHDGKGKTQAVGQIVNEPSFGQEGGNETRDSGPKKSEAQEQGAFYKGKVACTPCSGTGYYKGKTLGSQPAPKKGKKWKPDGTGETCFDCGGAGYVAPKKKRIAAKDKKEAKQREDQIKPRKPNSDGTAPQSDTKDKKGRRVMHDTGECFTPFGEPLGEALGSNPAPREGDLIIDSTTRIPFKVNRVLTPSKVEVIDNPDSKIPTGNLPSLPVPRQGVTSLRQMDISTIEKGLTSGAMQRIKTESAEECFTEGSSEDGHAGPIAARHICPNCIVPLKQEDTSFLCPECSFVAVFADVGSE